MIIQSGSSSLLFLDTVRVLGRPVNTISTGGWESGEGDLDVVGIIYPPPSSKEVVLTGVPKTLTQYLMWTYQISSGVVSAKNPLIISKIHKMPMPKNSLTNVKNLWKKILLFFKRLKFVIIITGVRPEDERVLASKVQSVF